MVEVRIVVGNDEIPLIGPRLAAFQKTLAPDMTTGGESGKVQSATATHAFISRLLRQIREHELRISELERQEKEKRDSNRIRTGKGGRR